jgi:hypothetical protein
MAGLGGKGRLLLAVSDLPLPPQVSGAGPWERVSRLALALMLLQLGISSCSHPSWQSSFLDFFLSRILSVAVDNVRDEFWGLSMSG